MTSERSPGLENHLLAALPRFGQVIRSIPREWKLDHFLNDGDSPDIPIPVYVGYLNEIRRLALTDEKR